MVIVVPTLLLPPRFMGFWFVGDPWFAEELKFVFLAICLGGEDVITFTGAGGAEADPSDRPLPASEDDDLGDALAASERAGHETAPITGPASTRPLEGLFHAGFFPRDAAAALPPPPGPAPSDGDGRADAPGASVGPPAGWSSKAAAGGGERSAGWIAPEGDDGAAGVAAAMGCPCR